MNHGQRVGLTGLIIAGIALFLPAVCRAQSSGADAGIDSGNYNIQQSVELGWRSLWMNGNLSNYDTFVDYGQGPRLLDYTLDMSSLNHEGTFFDNLSFSNFGYGGDPNDVTRLHINKNKWYDFQGLFRRDKDYWNYNLFANPLNPSSSNPAIAITSSPNALDTVRRMQDYSLTLMPQAAVRYRLGFTHNDDQGPEMMSTDFGVSPLLTGGIKTTMNEYRAGVDFRFLPKTTLSYDQFLEWDKEDDYTTDNNRTFQLANGALVDEGLVWATAPSSEVLPCAAPIVNAATTPITVNPTCSGMLAYSRINKPRNFMPTERFSFNSSYFKNFEMTGAFSYSTANNQVTEQELISGLTAGRTDTLGSTAGGPADAKRVFVHGEWSGVYSVTPKFQITDVFRYDNWRIPGLWDTSESDIFSQKGTPFPSMLLPVSQFSPSTLGATATFASVCPAPFTAITCPQHISGSPADFETEINPTFLGQNLRQNTFQLQYDFTPRVSGRIGFLYDNRAIATSSVSLDTNELYFPGGPTATAGNDFLAARGECALAGGKLPAGCTLLTSGPNAGAVQMIGVDVGAQTPRSITSIFENAILFGFTARPIDTMRIDGDFDFGHNSAAFTRTNPTTLQIYKIHANYKPRQWVNLDAAVNIQQNADTLYQVNDNEHARAYSFLTSLFPNSKITFELGYTYTDNYSQANVCFAYSTIPVTTPFGVNTCPIAGSPVTLGALGFYSSKQHYAYSDIVWKPIKRLTAGVGYSGTFVGGSTLVLNPLTPAGTLAFNYQKPNATIQFDLYRGLSYITQWNYYGYNDKAPVNVPGLAPIGTEDFNGSTGLFAVRYAF